MSSINKQTDVVALVASDPQLASVLSKVVQSKNPIERQNDTVKHQNLLNSGQITQLSNAISAKSENNRNILQLFPDLELAAQIVVSSALSPKDMIFQELIYKCNDNQFPAEISSKLIARGKEVFEGVYKFDKEISEILRSILFQNGAEIKIVVPENILDDIINENSSISTESFSGGFMSDALKIVFGASGPSRPENIGYISNIDQDNNTRCSLESILSHNPNVSLEDSNNRFLRENNTCFTNLIDFSDNFNLLKIPGLITHQRKKLIQSRINETNYSLESLKSTDVSKFTHTELKNFLYKDPNRKHSEILVVPDSDNASRRAVGRPLCMKLPVESVIPIHTPGNEKNHIGYFVLIDIDGNPVSKLSKYNKNSNLKELFQSGSAKDPVSSALLDRVKKNMVGETNSMSIDDIDKVFRSILEKNMLEKLSNGMYKGELEFAMNQEITATMLARTLAGKFTRLLFLPKEMVSYFVIRYNENGTGRSYLDDISFLTSIRATILLSKVVGMTKNAIPITHVNMILDPKDRDPENTIAMALHEIVKTRNGSFPVGSNSPLEILDYINRAGLEVTFEGHPGLPATKLEFENKKMDHALPDEELDETLRRQTYMAFGLSPELVDNGYSAEFAASVTANNVMMAKNTSVIQEAYSNCITEHHQRILGFDQTYLDECLRDLEDNKAVIEKSLSDKEKEEYAKDSKLFMREYLKKFIKSITVEFPKPDESALTILTEKFDEYSDAVDKALKAIISSDVIPQELAGELNGNIEVVAGLWKAHLLRKWMSNNNFVPEAMDLTDIGEDGDSKSNLNEITVMHVKAVMMSVIDLFKSIDSAKKAANKDLEQIGQEPSSSTGGSDSGSSEESGSDESSETGSEGADDGSGMDEFNMSDMSNEE